jgi:hypothetical protein
VTGTEINISKFKIITHVSWISLYSTKHIHFDVPSEASFRRFWRRTAEETFETLMNSLGVTFELLRREI